MEKNDIGRLQRLIASYGAEDLKNIIDNLCDARIKRLTRANKRETSKLKNKYKYYDTSKCQSPIEIHFLMAFIKQYPNIKIIPQFQVGPFVADFRINHPDSNDFIIVELDGKDFHTPERDSRKNKYYEDNNYNYIRFTGTDVHRRLDACIKEALVKLFNE